MRRSVGVLRWVAALPPWSCGFSAPEPAGVLLRECRAGLQPRRRCLAARTSLAAARASRFGSFMSWCHFSLSPAHCVANHAAQTAGCEQSKDHQELPPAAADFPLWPAGSKPRPMQRRRLTAWLATAAACLLVAGGSAGAQQVEPPRKRFMRPKRGSALVRPAGSRVSGCSLRKA